MKKIFLFITLILTAFGSLQARMNRDGEIIIGSGTGSSYGEALPTHTYYKYSYSQQIYLASEMNTSGTVVIDRISFQYFYATEYTRNVTIYLGHTTKESFANSTDWVQYDDLQQVYEGNVVFNNSGTDNWVDIALDSPFIYDGNDNLVVAFDDNTGSYNNGSAKFYTHSASPNYRVLAVWSDGQNYDPATPTFGGNRYNYLNNIKLRTTTLSCMPPSLAVSDIQSRQATLTFASGSDGATIVVEYKRTSDDDWTTISGTSPYTLTELTPGTNYSVRAKNDCGGGDESFYVTKKFRTPSENLSTIYVTSTGNGNHGGSSWDNATNSLVDALQLAAQIMVEFPETRPDIWVAAGTYIGAGTSDNAFTMVEGVDVYGGFAGTETSIDQRVKGSNETILDGQELQRVVYQENNFSSTKETIWDGFTIKNGKIDGSGAGAYIRQYCVLQNCKITNNNAGVSSSTYGGGVSLNGGTLRDCEICNNAISTTSYYGHGGGVYTNGNVTIERCQIHHNTSSKSCGGLYVCSSTSTVTDSEIHHNSSNDIGGIKTDGNTTVKNCKIYNNTTTSGAGGVYASYNDKYVNCLIANNTASGNGGGVFIVSSTQFINCDIVSNLSTATSSSYNGGGVYVSGSPTFINTVIWGNKRGTAYDDFYVSGGTPTMKNCAITGGYVGEGNISIYANNTGDGIHPKFTSPTEAGADYENGDWTLLEGSALINKGDDASVSEIENDLAGNDRIRQGRVDIGVYESDFTSAYEIVADETNHRIYVKQGATGDGSSWASPTPYLDLAISAASTLTPKCDVWVAAGTYQGNGTSSNAFYMQAGVSIYGGFEGDENSIDERDDSHETILDGQNSQRVLLQDKDFTAETAIVIDGFTIQNGGGALNGTGAYLQKFSTLRNCKVKNCVSTKNGAYGGGIYAKYSTIEDCEIFDNSLTNNNFWGAFEGGGVYIENGTLRNCEIHGNTIPNAGYYTYGGGVRAKGTSTVENCHIYGNSVKGWGGGISTYGNGSTNQVTVTNCVIEGNSTTSYNGGGVYSARTTFTNCKIINNITTDGHGGGAYSVDYDTYMNCLIANNTASGYYSEGGGVYATSSYSKYIGCDIVGNLMTSTNSSYSGGGMRIYSSSITVTNCAIWGNKKNDVIDNIYVASYNPTVTYCAVEGGYAGTGNVSLSSTNEGAGMNHPKFTSPATAAGAACTDGVWTLQEGSALINKGTTEGLTLPDNDLAGNSRVQNDKIDIGAYESEFNAAFEIVPTDGIIYVSENGSGLKNGSSWTNATPYFSMALSEATTMSPKPEIWVKAGTYTGDVAAQNAFRMVEGVDVYGGFGGTETALDQRDINANLTILDGQNVQRVLLQDNDFTEATATVWDGFTIQHGGGNHNGAGAYLYKYGTLKNCIIANNNSTNRYGGGVYLNYGSLEDCEIHHNTLIYNSSYSNSYGGGVYCYYGSVKNCEIYENNSSNSNTPTYAYAGGLYLDRVASAENCYIHNNTAGGYGGGICTHGEGDTKHAVVKSCRIENNTAQNYGGGVHSDYYSTFINCNIANNTVTNYYGGGVWVSYYNSFVNCNIVNNLITSTSSSYNGAGVYFSSSSYTYFTNCLIWGNKKNDASNQIYGTATVTYSAIEGGYSGAGNINLSEANTGDDLHPMFENPSSGAGAAYSGGNWNLQMGSACINNGTSEELHLPTGVTMPDTDIAGNQRVQRNIIDIGAYESPYNAVVITHDDNNRIYVTAEGAGEMDGSSWANATSNLQLAVNKAAAFTPRSTVWVKEGTYVNNGSGENSFTMVAGVTVIGGFAGDETDLSQRDFEAHPTILNGNGTKRVLYQAENYTSETEAVWDGFTLTNGYSNDYCSAAYMRYYSKLRNCKIINNNGTCPVYMSGYCTIENSLIADNASSESNYTAGVYMSSHTTLKQCTVVNNKNEHNGAGVYVYSNGVLIQDCIIWGNKKKVNSNYVANNIVGNASNMVVKNTAVEGGYAGIGNIPLMAENTGSYTYHVAFVDPTNGNYKLSANSICLKRASDATDMGAFNSNYTPLININPDANDVIYVTASGAGSKDGSSWANATPYLQLAVNLANTHDPIAQVWVKEGTYYGIMAYENNAFEMAPGVKVYGGFDGTETTLAERDFRNNVTILDGANTRRVLNQQFNFSSTTWAEWNGFTIRNGKRPNSGYGAGVYMLDYSNLKNCKVLNNESYYGGGGIYVYSTKNNECDTITNCIIQGNKSSNHYGGGIYVDYYGYVTNCLITNNTATYGGGVYSSSYTNIVNATIANNSVTNGNGGGIYGNLPTMRNCVVWGNKKGDASNQIYYANSYTNQFAYCAIEGGGYSGVGNIALESSNNGSGQNPNFMSPTTTVGSGATGGDWTLNTGSVLINKGTQDGIVVPATDLAGNARVYDSKIDLGPYESENAGGIDIVADSHNIVYVKAGGNGDGSSWTNASGDLQFAVNRASAFNPVPKIWVAKGTYTGLDGNASAFTMAPGVSVFGGFAGTEEFVDANNDGEYDDYDQRDFFNNETVLDGRERQRVLNQQVVFTEATKATWDGFTIKNGRVNGNGAGVRMVDYSILRNCKVFDNETTGSNGYGGGIYSDGYGNNNDSQMNVIANCEIRNNNAGRGGGILMARTIVENCEIRDNECSYTYSQGGGIYSESGRISNCEISGNTSYYYGGVYASGTRIVNSTIVDNTTTYENSNSCALYMANSYLDNDIIWGNEVSGGTQIKEGNNSSSVNNCAIEGGYTGSSPSSNVINLDAEDDGSGSANYIRFLDVQHNVFDLKSNSVAVNAGNNSATGVGTVDLNGNVRVNGENVDLGAREYYTLNYRYASKTIGYGGSYTFFGNVLTEPGRYTKRWRPAGNDCDSLVVLDLRISSAIYYVKAGGEGTQDGSSWANAMADINDAIVHAHDVTGFDSRQVWVAAGTYSGNTNKAAFEMMDGVSVYGGFVGGETSLSQRNPETNITILNSSSTYYSLVKASTTNPPTAEHKAMIDGFVLQAGGKVELNANMILTNSTVNVKVEMTGGKMEDVLFTNMNTNGGLVATNATVKNCVFANNNFSGSSNSLITLNNSALDTCQIYANIVNRDVIFATNNSTITGTSIFNNTGKCGYTPNNYYGAIINATNTTINHCNILNNSSLYSGYIYDICNYIYNMDGDDSHFRQYKYTIITMRNSLMENTIVWGNTQNVVDNNFIAKDRNSHVNYCAIEGSSVNGIGNIRLTEGNETNAFSPKFYNPITGAGNIINQDAYDWTLKFGSVCLKQGREGCDIGANASTYARAMFLIENPVSHKIYVAPEAVGAKDGSSWNDATNNLQYAVARANTFTPAADVWVKEGVYTGDDVSANAAFTVIEGVNVYGGFVGNEDFYYDIKKRDVVAHKSILDGQGVQRVLLQSEPFADTAKWDGFVIRNGYLTEDEAYSYNSVSLWNYAGNQTQNEMVHLVGAGAVILEKGVLRKTTFEDNKIVKSAFNSNNLYCIKGAELAVAEGVIDSITICGDTLTYNSNNKNYNSYLVAFNAKISNSQFNNNFGKIYSVGTTFRNCYFENNAAEVDFDYDDGNKAVLDMNGDTLVNCRIRNNNSVALAKSLYGSQYANTYINCDISHNSNIVVKGHTLTGGDRFINCNIISNKSETRNNVLLISGGAFHNTVVWNNRNYCNANSDFDRANLDKYSFNHCAVELGFESLPDVLKLAPSNTGSSAVYVYPNFVAPAGDDYDLCNGSALIDAGDDAIVTEPKDIMGRERIGGAVDIGMIESGCLKRREYSATTMLSQYPFYGEWLTKPGTYVHRWTPNNSDCDSVVVLNLTMKRIIYVKEGGGGLMNGSSWENAFADLRIACDSTAGKEGYQTQIWVAAGLYRGDGTSVNAFTVHPNVQLYGGLTGTELANYDLTQRNLEENVTILDGDYIQRVIFQEEDATETTPVVIDGFKIMNGFSRQDVADGTALMLKKYCIVRNCTITENYTNSGVGAIRIESVDFENCDKRLAINTIENCKITNNQGENAIECENTLIKDCEISGNDGVGVMVDSYTKIDGCTISSNKGRGVKIAWQQRKFSDGLGFEERLVMSHHDIIDTKIASNAGGVYYEQPKDEGGIGDGVYVNTVIAKNNITSSSDSEGGGIYKIAGKVQMYNCLVYNNKAKSKGGGLYGIYDEIVNTIFYGNTAGSKKNQLSDYYYFVLATDNGVIVYADANHSNVRYSAVEGGYPGEGNITLSSDYPVSLNSGYTLRNNSVCIDAGTTEGLTLPEYDLFGNSRVRGGGIDIGVHETNYTGERLINDDANHVIYVDTESRGEKDGSSWENATSELQMAMNLSMTMDPQPVIWVKKGTYTLDKSNDWSMISIMPGVKLYGGFAGNENSTSFNLNDRDFTNNTTFFDAKGTARFIDQYDNFKQDEKAVIDGFTIRNGAAEQRYKDRIPSGQVSMFEDEFKGGALRLMEGVTLRNCEVYNSNANYGGALYMANGGGNGTSLITNTKFHDNYAFKEGGALYVGRSMAWQSHPMDTIANCEISDNEADRHGGMRAAWMHITNTSIVKNNTAMYEFDTVTSTNRNNEYRNCLLWGNSSRNYANQIEGSDNTYKYCAIQGGYTGEGNVNIEKYNTGDDPSLHYAKLIDPDNRVYRPTFDSYHANKGNNAFVNGAFDLAGKDRINNDIVDMGAYEVGCIDHEHLKVIANEYYVFYGDTLRVSGHYQRQWTQQSGTCDSLVSLELEVRKIWYVTTTGGVEVKDGASWETAFDNIQTAINTASAFKTDAKKQIWIAKGTYQGSGSGTQAFTLKPGVEMYGGFAGDETNGIEFSERDLIANATILDGANSQRVIGNYNAYSKFTLTENATVDGFTIQNGYTVKEGSGVYVKNYVKIQNCIIKQNQGGKGAGIYADNKCEITDCKIYDNTALTEGGGAWIKSSTFTYCEIHNNLITNIDEESSKYGGGIYGENATINNCLIANNSVLTNKSYGGGMYIANSTLPSQLLNCTVVNNFSYDQGGGVYSVNHGSNNDFINCIMWGNRTDKNTQQVAVSASNVPIYVRYSAIQGGAGGLGTFNLTATNNDADMFSPKFVNPTTGAGASYSGGDWHIKESSILVNQGERLTYTIEQDLDDNLRVKNGRIDIGAYETEGTSEFAVHPDTHNIIYVNKANTTGNWSGDSWANAIPDLQFAINFAADNDGYPKIWVAKGTYTGNGWPYVDAFIGLNGIDLYGGFIGNEAYDYNLDNRNLTTNATILDGQNIQRALHQASNQYFKYSLDPQHSAIYDGFTLKNGFTFKNCGANLYMIKGDVKNMIIENGHTLVGLDGYWEHGVGAGGIYGETQNITVSNSIIRNNKASSCNGGGYYGNMTFNNCLINNNSAIIDDTYPSSDSKYSGNGGAGYGSAKHYNSTIVNNLAVYDGGGIAGYGNVYNSVLWGNKLTDNTPCSLETSSVVTPDYNNGKVKYSAIEGGFKGEGNITLNKDNSGTNDVNFPKFVTVTAAAGAGNYGNGDWHIQDGSVLANHGSTLYKHGDKDLDGTARIKNDSIDLGAYESDYNFDYEIIPDDYNIIYVTQNGAGSMNGSSWTNATPYLQFAMERASLKKTKPVIWVAQGTYHGNGVPYYPAFLIPDGVNIYGGFAGNEVHDYDLAERDFDTHITTLDGQELQQVVRCDKDNGSNIKNIIDGFTVTRGRANREGGGGAFEGCDILNCKFLNNSTTFDDDGLTAAARYYGAGGVLLNGNSTMKYSQVVGNTTNGIGGGVIGGYALINCLIKNNTAQFSTGGVRNTSYVQNCEVSFNTVTNGSGGGLYGIGEISNSTIAYNTAAVNSQNQNDPGYNGGGTKYCNKIYNSIAWGNKCGTVVSNIRTDRILDMRYSACERDNFTIDISQGNIELETTNTGSDVKLNYVSFMSPDEGDFQLADNSACVDRGSNSLKPDEAEDLAGNERVINETVDMGCYEHKELTCPLITALTVPDDDIDFTTARVTWTPGGSESHWIVYYNTVGGNEPVVTEYNTNDITLTGLTSYTDYYVKVRAKCSDTDMSPYSTPVYFSTLCDPDDIVWTNDFDEENILPSEDQPMVSNSTILFSWDHIDGADYYDVYLWRDDDGHGLEIPDFPCRKNLTQNYCNIDLYQSYYQDYGIYPLNAHDNRFDPIVSGYLEQTEDEDIAYYAWYVVAHKDCDTIVSDTMHFNTALPDLHITAMDCSYAQTGQPMTVTWTVRNDGHGPVPTGKTWTDYIILSYPIDWSSESFDPNNAESFVIARVPNLTTLAVGEQYTNNFNITVPDDMVGAAFLFVVSNWRPYESLGLNFAQYGGVFPNPYTPSETGYPYYYMSGTNEDAGNATFEEINGVDDFFYKAIEIAIPPIPDLVVRNVIPPYENVAGDSITISWQLINQGGAGFENLYVTDNVYLTTDTVFDSGVEQLGQFSSTISLAKNDTITRVAKFPTNERYGGQTFNFFVQTDVRNTVYESLFEHNNESPISEHPCEFIVPEVPDLQVASVNFSKKTASIKEKIDITYTVRNAGFTNTGTNNNPWTYDSCGYMPPIYGKSWSDRIYISDLDTLDISSPNTKQIGSASNSNILWTLDQIDLIADTIEEFVWCKYPAIQQPDPTASPEEWALYYQEKTLQDARRDALRQQKLALYSNSYTKTVTAKIPSDYVEGEYFIYIVTDYNDNIFEHVYENNNTMQDSVYVLQPDMKIVYMHLAPERDSLHYAVTNIGNGTAFGNINTYDGGISSTVTYNNADIAYGYIPIDTMMKGDTIQSVVPLSLECNFYERNTLKLLITGEGESDYTNNTLIDTIYLYNPDFLAHDIVMPTTNLNSGEDVEVTFHITNDGTANFLDTVAVGFYLGLSPELNFITAEQIKLVEIPTMIDIGQTNEYTETVTIPVDAQGVYYLYVYVNDGEEVCEGANNATDYIVSEMLSVTLSPYPDLVVTDASVPDHATAGSTVEISYTVENQGTRAANATESWMDKIYVSSSPVFDVNTAIQLDMRTKYGPLDINGSYSVTAQVTIPVNTGDDQYFYIVTDALDAVYEYIGENNNIYQSALVPVSLYNCDLAAVSLSGETNVSWGDTLTYSYEIHNNGTSVTTGIYYNAIYLSTDESFDSDDTQLKMFSGQTLNGGQSQTGNAQVIIPYGPTGSHYLLLVADYTGVNPDLNNANNKLAVPITMSGSPVPDLEISEVTMVTEYPAAGQPIRIAYKVTNIGDGTTNVAWKDKVFVSRNTLQNSYVAESKDRTMHLAQGEYYRDTTSFVIPIPQTGNFAVYLAANGRLNGFNAVGGGIADPVFSFFEMNYENNQSMVAVSVDLNAPGDLVVEEVNHAYEVTSGDDMLITWHIKNNGPNLISGQGCSDVLYLSTDETFDSDDKLLGSITHSVVIPNYSYETYSYTANIGGVPEGDYYVIVYTDARNAFYEVDEDNNRGFSTHPVKVNLPELYFDSIQPFQMRDLTYKDFKLNVWGNINETVRIHVETPDNDLGAVNNIYVKHNGIGDNMDFDFSTNGQMTGNSEVYIPATKAGYYGVSVWGYTPNGDTQDMTIEANILPFEIRSVEADKGGNTGKITLKLIGSKFRYDMPVILYKGEFDSSYFDIFDHDIEADVIKMDTLYYVNFNEAFVTFDLTGAALGTYSIAAYNYCAGYTHLDNCFTVVKGEPENLSSNLIIPSGLRQNRYCILTLEYGNIGTNDIVNPRVQLISNGGSYIGLRRGELNIHRTELEIPIGNDEEPEGILRPGVRYTVSIYCYTNDGLLFTINVNDDAYRYEQFKEQMNNGN